MEEYKIVQITEANNWYLKLEDTDNKGKISYIKIVCFALLDNGIIEYMIHNNGLLVRFEQLKLKNKIIEIEQRNINKDEQ